MRARAVAAACALYLVAGAGPAVGESALTKRNNDASLQGLHRITRGHIGKSHGRGGRPERQQHKKQQPE